MEKSEYQKVKENSVTPNNNPHYIAILQVAATGETQEVALNNFKQQCKALSEMTTEQLKKTPLHLLEIDKHLEVRNTHE